MGRPTRELRLKDPDQNGPGPEVTRRGRKRQVPLVNSHSAVGPKKKAKESTLLPVPSRSETCDGVVLTVGQGDTGQLGLGPDVMEKSRPALVSLSEPVTDIAAGGMHTICLTKSGQVYTFGCNDECALGRETETEDESTRPGKVHLPEKIVQISAGDSHSAALSDLGHVFIWGNFRDSNGPMGLTVNGRQHTPVRVMQGVRVVQVASGSDHLVFLSADGTLYSCGNGEQGQLGRISPHKVQTGGRCGPGLLLNPQPILVYRRNKPIQFDQAWASSYATFARVKSTGEIYGFGLNNYSQLGFNDEKIRYHPQRIDSFSGRKWTVISGGQHHTVALDEAGNVYSLGRKEYGRLGLGEDGLDQVEPTLVTSLREEKCLHVECGDIVSYAVSNRGVVYSWGMGTNGQLGHGNDEDVFVPQVIGGKVLSTMTTRKIAGGGQHSVILAEQQKQL